MKHTKPKKRRAHEILVDDWIYIGGKLFRVHSTQPGYFGPAKVSLTMIDPDDPKGPLTSLLIPRHTKLLIVNQKE